jgi:hypothetical protein
METLQEIKDAIERHPSSRAETFELMDITLRPKDIYLVLDALYNLCPIYLPDDGVDPTVDHAEELIKVLESELEQAGLPTEVEEYENPSLHPEEVSWKQLGIFDNNEQD